MDDLGAVPERALATRRTIVFERREFGADCAVMYQALAGGDWISAEEYERTLEKRDEELRMLERALLPLAKAAFEPGRNVSRGR